MTENLLPTPETIGESKHSAIPPIPILPLPHLPSSTLPAANLFSGSSSSGSPGLTSSPRKSQVTAGLSDPFELKEKDAKGKVSRLGSVEQRKQAMMERVRLQISYNTRLTANRRSKHVPVLPLHLHKLAMRLQMGSLMRTYR